MPDNILHGWLLLAVYKVHIEWGLNLNALSYNWQWGLDSRMDGGRTQCAMKCFTSVKENCTDMWRPNITGKEKLIIFVRWYSHHLRKSSTYGRFSLANLVISATTSGGQTSRGEIPLLLSICTSAPSCIRKAATTTYGSTTFPSLRATNWSLTYIHINNKQTIIISVNQHNVKSSFNVDCLALHERLWQYVYV